MNRRAQGLVMRPGVRRRCVRSLSRSRSLSLAFAFALSGCSSMLQLADPASPACGVALKQGFESILLEQDENAQDARALADRAQAVLGNTRLGPRPFVVSSPSGADYGFFFTGEPNACVLRLFSRQRGFTRYTNNLGGIASRDLPGCSCRP